MRRRFTFDTGDTSYHLKIKHASPYILTAGDPGRIEKVADLLENPAVIRNRGLVTVQGSYKRVPITAFSTGMGPASVSITLPEVIEACDQDIMRIVRVGTGGAMQPNIHVGDIVVSEDYERAESTSDKIMGNKYAAKTDLTAMAALYNAVCDLKDGQNVFVGLTRTTDDIYFDANYAKQRKVPKGLLAVSMEGSVHCAVRDRYNKDDNRQIYFGELLGISDNVVAHEVVDLNDFLVKKEKMESLMIRSGLDALVMMSR